MIECAGRTGWWQCMPEALEAHRSFGLQPPGRPRGYASIEDLHSTNSGALLYQHHDNPIIVLFLLALAWGRAKASLPVC